MILQTLPIHAHIILERPHMQHLLAALLTRGYRVVGPTVRETVILIDAVSSGAELGTIYRFDALEQPIPTNVSLRSTHSLNLAEALSIADILHRLPSRLIVYGIEGKHFGTGVRLSPQVEDAMKTIIEQVEHECL